MAYVDSYTDSEAEEDELEQEDSLQDETQNLPKTAAPKKDGQSARQSKTKPPKSAEKSKKSKALWKMLRFVITNFPQSKSSGEKEKHQQGLLSWRERRRNKWRSGSMDLSVPRFTKQKKEESQDEQSFSDNDAESDVEQGFSVDSAELAQVAEELAGNVEAEMKEILRVNEELKAENKNLSQLNEELQLQAEQKEPSRKERKVKAENKKASQLIEELEAERKEVSLKNKKLEAEKAKLSKWHEKEAAEKRDASRLKKKLKVSKKDVSRLSAEKEKLKKHLEDERKKKNTIQWEIATIKKEIKELAKMKSSETPSEELEKEVGVKGKVTGLAKKRREVEMEMLAGYEMCWRKKVGKEREEWKRLKMEHETLRLHRRRRWRAEQHLIRQQDSPEWMREMKMCIRRQYEARLEEEVVKQDQIKIEIEMTSDVLRVEAQDYEDIRRARLLSSDT